MNKKATSLFLLLVSLAVIFPPKYSFARAFQDSNFEQQPDSDEVLLKKAEDDIKQSKFRSALARRAEARLKELLARYPDSPLRAQAEEKLYAVQEELAARELLVAQFYLRRFDEGKASQTKGAETRLRHILCAYPRFSRIEEVIIDLVRIYSSTGNAEATTRMQRFMNKPANERNYDEACQKGLN